MPIRNWPQAMNQFIILHEDRLKDYVWFLTEVFTRFGLQGLEVM